MSGSEVTTVVVVAVERQIRCGPACERGCVCLHRNHPPTVIEALRPRHPLRRTAYGSRTVADYDQVVVAVTVVNACLRDGRGGSPTAVLDEMPLSDAERRAVPARVGASHAVFVAARDDRSVSLRFFTVEGELPACGHGTVAALAFLAERASAVDHEVGRAGAADHEVGRAGASDYEVELHTRQRVLPGRAVRAAAHVDADFDPGPIVLREPTGMEENLVLSALRTAPGDYAGGARVASLGRARLLVPLATRAAVADLDPDLDRLRAAADRLGLLGCYAYSVPAADGRLAARMFAPSIGVPEDIANANSTACLAACLAGAGSADIAVDMGDSVGSPAAIVATARPGPSGTRVRVGGAATVAGVRHLA